MYIKSASLILAGLMAQGLMASPFPAPSFEKKLEGGSTLVVSRDAAPSFEQKLEGGSTLIVSRGVEEDDEDEPVGLAKRIWPFDSDDKTCKVQRDPRCDDKNGGPNALCNELVTQLYGYSDIPIGEKDRQVCIKDASSSLCCVKWTKDIKYLKKGDLATRVDTMNKICTQNGISGKLDKTLIRGVCTSFCVNNGAGCKNLA